MIKQRIFLFLLLFFFLSKSLFVSSVFAQNIDTESSSSGKVEYELPYPGILPDNPLYFLKTFRDRMVSYLINNPLKKAEFNLLTSNKRVNAGLYLSDKKKYELAIVTFSKGTNYFSEGVEKVNEAIKAGQDAQMVLQNMRQSIKKHQEILKTIKEKAPDELSPQIEYEAKRLQELEKIVNKLSLKK